MTVLLKYTVYEQKPIFAKIANEKQWLRKSIRKTSDLTRDLQIKIKVMNTNNNITRLNRAEKIAWIIFLGLGLNYFLITLILSLY